MWRPSRRQRDCQPELSWDEIEVPWWLVLEVESDRAGFGQILRRLPSLLRQATGIMWQTSPAATVSLVVLQLCVGVAAGVSLLNVASALQPLLAGGPTPQRLREALPSLVVVMVAGAIRQLLVSASAAVNGWLSPRVNATAELRLVGITSGVALTAFDEASWQDLHSRARHYGVDAMERMVDQAVAVAAEVVSLLAAASVLGVLHPLLVALMILAVAPTAWASIRSARMSYRVSRRVAAMSRRKAMINDLLTQRWTAAELRAFTLRGWLMAELRRLTGAAISEYTRLSHRQVFTNLVGATLGGAATGMMYLALGVLLWTEQMSLAGAGAAVVALQTGLSALHRVAYAVNQVYAHGLYVADYLDFCQHATGLAEPVVGPPAPSRFSQIRLTGASFTYSDATRPALDDVTLTIPAGTTLALVGENGSGKTTLAKLLAGLFPPQPGQLWWDDTDLSLVDSESVRGHVAVVMQDPTEWPFTAATTISIGRHDQPATLELIELAARRGDAHQFITELPNGYDTLLTRSFRSGVDLSGGQWQRLAVARAFYRDARVLICDEPTANLDAKAEHAFYDRLRRLARGRTVILITHRLASVRDADHIVVLDRGHIIEQGNHEQLLAAGGKYATLFRLQAAAYTQPVSAATAAADQGHTAESVVLATQHGRDTEPGADPATASPTAGPWTLAGRPSTGKD